MNCDLLKLSFWQILDPLFIYLFIYFLKFDECVKREELKLGFRISRTCIWKIDTISREISFRIEINLNIPSRLLQFVQANANNFLNITELSFRENNLFVKISFERIFKNLNKTFIVLFCFKDSLNNANIGQDYYFTWNKKMNSSKYPPCLYCNLCKQKFVKFKQFFHN